MRRKNLLEAFKKSDAAGAPPAGAAPSGSASTGASSRGVPAGPLFERPVSASAGSTGQPARALVGVGLVLAFALGFALGRGTGGESRAEEKAASDAPPRRPPVSQPRAFQERPAPSDAPTGATETPARSRRLEESPLFDTANVYTVVVVAYSNTSEDLAWATYEHLHDQGLAVFPPVASKNLILVLVGAAPTSGELAKTEASVRALQRDGKKPYETAYRARIDALIPRSPK